jgi:hypothetical protein
VNLPAAETGAKEATLCPVLGVFGPLNAIFYGLVSLVAWRLMHRVPTE